MIKNNLCEETIKKISYRKNVILIEFNKNMNITGEHSYLEIQNYAIKKSNLFNLLPKGTIIQVVKNGYIIKIILPKESNYLNDKCNLNLGYIFRNKLFYIESKYGIVDFPYNSKNIGKEIEEINLSNGVCEIIDNNTLKYIYNGKNKFFSINIEDFYIEKSNKIYYSNYFIMKSNKEIIFKFKDDIFCEKNERVWFKLNTNPKSKDIYGFFISERGYIKVIDKKMAYIESLSFSNYENNKAFLKIKFSKPLLKFYSKDFSIKYDNKIYNIEFLNSDSKNMVIDVVVDNIIVKYFLRGIFKLFMAVKYEEVQTIDYLGKKVFIKEEISSKYFSSTNISWDLHGYDLKNSLIKITFKEEILPSSIITNSNFDLEVKEWNSRILIIPPGKIILSYNNKNEQVLSLSNNKEFGKIVICFTNNIYNNKKTKFNDKPVLLYIKNNNLFINFNKEETLSLDILDIANIKYYPGVNIRSLENYFIFYGYHPIGKINFTETIINLKPLESEKYNPFKGGIIKASYILNVDNENNFRTYGVYENITIIEGFVKILGNLTFNQMIFIKNLKVKGKIYIDIGNGNIELDKLECNDLLCN